MRLLKIGWSPDWGQSFLIVSIALILSGIAGVMLAGANMLTDAQLLTLIAWFYQPRVILIGALLSTLVSLWFLWLFNDLLRALTQFLRSRAWYFDAQRERLEKDTAKD